MYKLNYLSIILILLAFFVFYNEFNKELNCAEMAILAIAFIAILRASYNYIELDNSNKQYTINASENVLIAIIVQAFIVSLCHINKLRMHDS